MAALLFPGGFDPRQVGALPRRPRLPAPGRRVPAPAQAGAGGFPKVWASGEPLACGLTPFGNRTRQTSTGRLLSAPLGQPPSPIGKASTTARCPAASGRPKTGTRASPRCSGNDVSRAPLCFVAALLSLGGFDPRQIRPRLPAPGRRVPRPPRQARADFPATGPWRTPCLRAYARRQSDPANVHWTFAFGSSGPAPIPYRKCFDSFSPWP